MYTLLLWGQSHLFQLSGSLSTPAEVKSLPAVQLKIGISGVVCSCQTVDPLLLTSIAGGDQV